MAPPWLSGVRAIAQSVASALPALILVIFAGLLALLGLICDQGRRSDALAYADRFVDLAAVLVGRHRGRTWPYAARSTGYQTIEHDQGPGEDDGQVVHAQRFDGVDERGEHESIRIGAARLHGEVSIACPGRR